MPEVEGVKLDALGAASAFAAEDLLALHDASADAGQRSKKATLAKLFGEALPQVGVKPTALSGSGTKFLELDPTAAAGLSTAMPVRMTMGSFANAVSARPNTVFRIGYNMTDGGAFRANNEEAAAALSFEQYFEQTEGVFWQETILQLYDAQGQGARPWAVYSSRDDLTTKLTVALEGTSMVFSPVTGLELTNPILGLDVLSDLYGIMLPEVANAFRFVAGDNALNAASNKGEILVVPWASGDGGNATQSRIAHVGGSSETLIIGGFAAGGSPDRNPRRVILSPESGSRGLIMRRQIGGITNVSFGLNTDPGTSGVTDGSLHFADGGDIVFKTATGTKIGTDAAQKFAFWGAEPKVRPTISTADAASIIAALADIGLVVDAT